MKPSPGVIAVAVVAILEGLLACLFGLFFFLGLVLMNIIPSSQQMPEMQTAAWVIMGVQGVIYLAVGGWFLASGIGLVRLKNWARISVMVMGALIAVFSLFGLLGVLMMSLVPFPSPPGKEVPQGFMTAMLWVMGMISLIQMGIGIWWVILLNRPGVRRLFQPVGAAESAAGLATEGAPVKTPSRPLSVTIIAWLMVASVISLPYYLLQFYPALVCGLMIEGWLARAYYLAYAIAHIIVGIGLLRLKTRFVDYAIGLSVFNLVNIAVTAAIPGSFRRFFELMMKQMEERQADVWGAAIWEQFIWLGVISGLLYVGIGLWFLVTRRAAYQAAAEHKLQSSGTGAAPD